MKTEVKRGAGVMRGAIMFTLLATAGVEHGIRGAA